MIILKLLRICNLKNTFKKSGLLINWRMDKQNVVFPYNRTVRSHIKERNVNPLSTTDEAWKHYTKPTKPDTKGHILYGHIDGFPRAALTKYHKVSGLKEQKCIGPQLWSPAIWLWTLPGCLWNPEGRLLPASPQLLVICLQFCVVSCFGFFGGFQYWPHF